jgi:hypothetical protein
MSSTVVEPESEGAFEALQRKWIQTKYPSASHQEAVAFKELERGWHRHRKHPEKRAELLRSLRRMCG